ncbi:monocarboxylate transporter 13-like [Lytechinus variegatus]|uniref:monocarboxylate transporter 13-like n=1 Tax=Lytechinus variegatus TaxID=7654 RepID=UPI001BB1A02A|nr:monocarboxylate transporter 13-like [Lytechinus variegatus]
MAGNFHAMVTSESFLIVLVTFLRTCGHVGIIKTMGIYLEDINRSLRTTPTDIGIALGLLSAFSSFPAPIIAALYQRRSIRRFLLVSGACLTPVGVALTSMATTNAQMAIFLSITGLGHCVIMVCSIISLHRVASNNYNLLFSLGKTGYGTGMVLIPFLAELLRKAYGWRGGLLIMSGLMAHIIPCAVGIKLDSDENIERDYRQVLSSSIGSDREDEEEQGEEETGKGKHDCNSCIRRDTKGNDYQPGALARITTSIRQSDFYSDPLLNVIISLNMTFFVFYSGWHSFLVPHTLQRGISIRDTLIITFTAAIGNTFSRVAVGVLTNNRFHPVTIFLFATVVDIVALLCDIYVVNYYLILVTSCVSAMSIGGRAILGALILRDRASPEKFHIAFSVDKVFQGFGMFAGGYFGGWIADHFSTYDATFKFLTFIDVFILGLITVIKIKPKPNPT